MIGDVTEIRESEDGRSENVFIMDKVCVGGGIGIALGFETESFGVGRVGLDFDDTVGHDGLVAIGDIRDDVADFEGFIIGRTDINHSADGEVGGHGAGHDGKGFEAEKFRYEKGKGETGDGESDDGFELRTEEFEASKSRGRIRRGLNGFCNGYGRVKRLVVRLDGEFSGVFGKYGRIGDGRGGFRIAIYNGYGDKNNTAVFDRISVL